MLGDYGLWDPQEMLARGKKRCSWHFVEVLGMRLEERRLCSKFKCQKKKVRRKEEQRRVGEKKLTAKKASNCFKTGKVKWENNPMCKV